MKTLIEKFTEYNESDVIWLMPGSESVNAGCVATAIAQMSTEDWRGKRVALDEMPMLEYVATLIFLDGLAEVILPLPNEDDAQARTQRLDSANIDIVLNGDGVGLTKRMIPARKISKSNQLCSKLAERRTEIVTTWLLPTSGTTGTPKLIEHTCSTLTRSMSNRRLGNDYVWGSLYSLRRFAGLQVFLQAWLSGTPLVLNEEGDDLDSILTNLIALGCNALSATPSMWRKLAMHTLFDQLNLKQITLGGEIVDQVILDLLAKRFPQARITHIYASTEAGVGFAVRDGRSGFPADYIDNPPAGIEMRVDQNGHLWFCPKLTEVDRLTKEIEWIDSGDVVKIDGERVRFLGRANGSINVGGNKVMPEEIESIINELPEIAFVQVRARRNALVGSLVEASIAVLPGNVLDAALKKKITAHCRNRLAAFKVPAFIVESTDIALTASGKLARERIQ